MNIILNRVNTHILEPNEFSLQHNRLLTVEDKHILSFVWQKARRKYINCQTGIVCGDQAKVAERFKKSNLSFYIPRARAEDVPNL